ncbi:MAG: 6-pyruvoyl tetrahydropterin synthase family protein [Herpetosiphonaceae bacterium]|nr:6-pyruvoyl tetrahydropterin synthase family protein [Herpetosiphonaceae bacterium]
MFRIEVTKDYLGFAAAHFITIKGKCERLHGHNYQVWVELEGDLTDDGYVCDFVELKQFIHRECQLLDHRVLLQTENPLLVITAVGNSINVRYGEQHYCFPAADVVLLPLHNTTAELLAEHLAHKLATQLPAQDMVDVQRLAVWVAEGPGQRACAQLLLSR